MKKFAFYLTVFLFFVNLSGCGQNGYYEEGYAAGYEVGYDDAESDMMSVIEDEFESGYDIGREDGYHYGYSDGYFDGSHEAEDECYYGWLEDEGISYARQFSEWSPEEAMQVIEAYHKNEAFWDDGSSPTHDEYTDAIESLYRFYEYFYCAMYE